MLLLLSAVTPFGVTTAVDTLSAKVELISRTACALGTAAHTALANTVVEFSSLSQLTRTLIACGGSVGLPDIFAWQWHT